MSDDGDDRDGRGVGADGRYSAHLDRGWALLERGDLATADESAAAAEALEPEGADAPMLRAAICMESGEPSEALRWYGRAIERDPDYAAAYIAAAQCCLFDLDDAPRALHYCDEAGELDGLSVVEALEIAMLGAEAEAALGAWDDVEQRFKESLTIAELGEFLSEDSEGGQRIEAFMSVDEDGDELSAEETYERSSRLLSIVLRLGRVWMDCGAYSDAFEFLAAAARTFPDASDIWHALSESASLSGEPRIAAAAALHTHTLDRREGVPPWVPEPSEIGERVRTLLSEAPLERLHTLADASSGVHLVVQEQPSPEMVLQGVDPRTEAYALMFAGPADERCPLPTADESIAGLVVYRANIARFAHDVAQFEELLIRSVYEEIATVLELAEGDREALGLDARATRPPGASEGPLN